MIRAARIFVPTSSIRLAFMDALVMSAVFFLLVRFTVFMDPSLFFREEHGAIRLMPVIAIMLLAMYFSGLYERKRIESRIFLLQQLGFAAGVSLIFQALVSYVDDRWMLPRNLAFYGLLSSLLALFGWRLLRDAMLSRLEGTGTVIILGTDETGHRVARHIASHPSLHLKVAGSVTNRPEHAVLPVLGDISDLREVVRRVRPDMIISGMADARDRMPVSEMVDLRYAGTRIEEAGAACELICRQVSARDLRPSRMLFTRDFDARDVSLAVFLVDTVSAALLLITGAPFALAYALLLWFSGKKPVIREEVCVGFKGVPFMSCRFRAEDSGAAAWLARGFHLDDWPQLWNVLRGRMSMVGPRPRRLGIARELSLVLPVHEYRQNTKPGITGWAQINLKRGPEATDAIAEVEYDLYYIRNQSFSLYTYILLHGLRASL